MPSSEIVITITKNGGVGGGGNVGNVGTQTSSKEKTKKLGETDVVNDAIKVAMIDAGKKVLQNAISQYGNLTGDYISQRRIDNMIKIAGYVSTIAVGGVVGAIAVGSDIVLSIANHSVEVAKSNDMANLLRVRSGNVNGGRNTND